MNKYENILEKITNFFDVNEDLRNDLNKIALKEHKITLDRMLRNWSKKISKLNKSRYKEVEKYLDDLNKEPHSIIEMEEMYDFVYEYENYGGE